MPADLVHLYFVYGVACVGKSTTALAFAAHHQLRTVIHTDYLREVQRACTPPDQAPQALAVVTHTAWQLHGPAPTPEAIKAGFLDHVDAVAAGIRPVVAKLVRDGFDAVLEGAHLHGGLIDELRTATTGTARLHARLLTVDSADELRARIRAKHHARASTAPPKQWQTNIPVLLTLQDVLVADAQHHRIPVVTAHEWRQQWPPPHPGSWTAITS